MKIRKGDLVHVLSGKDQGKQGRIIEADPEKRRVIVENLNLVKKHRKPRPMKDSSRMGQTQIQPGGVIDLAAPLPVSNVMLVCPTCNRPTRVGYEFRDDEKGRRVKVRVCKRVQVTRAKKSIAGFKIREGMPIGTKVTLRGARMWEFLDRLVSIALPRIRDFRGLSPASFDGRGNYSLGVREQIIFPEIDYDDVETVRGLDVTITTTADTDDEALALLRELGLPFRDEA